MEKANAVYVAAVAIGGIAVMVALGPPSYTTIKLGLHAVLANEYYNRTGLSLV